MSASGPALPSEGGRSAADPPEGPGDPGANQGRAAVSLRLDELAAAHGLGASQRAQLEALGRILAEDETAPTSVRAPLAVVDRHLADSLAALELPELLTPSRLADLGSGAGLPGLALAIAWPRARVALVESAGRKAAFLRRTVARIGLGNVEVAGVRVEDWAQGQAVHDLVTARALAAPAVVLEYAAPLLGGGGLLIDWRGRRDPGEEAEGLAAAAILGLERVAVHRSEPFADARDHYLHLYLKVRDTPERFPRRAGMARKRPLGRSTPG